MKEGTWERKVTTMVSLISMSTISNHHHRQEGNKNEVSVDHSEGDNVSSVLLFSSNNTFQITFYVALLFPSSTTHKIR
jgi:hypothetical protein